MCGTTWAIALAIALQTGPGPNPTSQAWPDDRPIIRLLPNLGEDLRSLSSETTLWLLAGGTVVAVGLSPRDNEVAAWMARKGASQWADIGEVLGDGWVQGAAALFTYGVGRLHGSAKVTHMGSDLVRAQILNGLLTKGLKLTIDRKRPDGGGHSFPSGHTAAAFASASVLHGHFGWKVAAPAYSLAAYIGWTRLREDQHWLSDLAAGATIGLIVGQAVTSGHRQRTWTVAPVPVRGGIGIVILKSS
ncbi:MAG TPA: phosphatase PAP2 family protein [Vicinamibacterales bacterium]|nr:phosphatase PAP2 family protein [Vicinamibacterales bacterium]